MNRGKVAVIGVGTMGSGIASVAAIAGHPVAVFDANQEALSSALDRIEKPVLRAVERGHLDSGAVDAVHSIQVAADLEEVCDQAMWVIEAVAEDLGVKTSLFAQLDQLAPADAVLGTNTSSLSITSIAKAVQRPGRVIGLHFFNPPIRMGLVEIVEGLMTDRSTIERAREFVLGLGKESIVVKDSPGFVTSRISAMVGNEAFYMLQEGLASPRDIDKGIRLALNHPMGPLELGDLVGLDVRLSILKYLHSTLGEKFRPSPLLIRYVEAGRLGKKTGRGVYRYDSDGRQLPSEPWDHKDGGS